MSYTIEERPTRLPALEDCFFYHTMEVPGHGLLHGQWDLRAGLEDYLGHVDLRGDRVLEIGPASGFLTFQMESRGAEVTACELRSFDQWDLVPYAGWNPQAFIEDRMELGRRLRNAFWLAHAAHGSRARLAACSVHDLPADLGTFDTAVFAMVLLHVRDPFRALQSALRQTTGTVIVTELLPGEERPAATGQGGGPPRMYFCPRSARESPKETWWHFNPPLVREFLGVLGFRTKTVLYHEQPFDPKYRWTDPDVDGEVVRHPCFTVVARRELPD